MAYTEWIDDNYTINKSGEVVGFQKGKTTLITPLVCRQGYLRIRLTQEGRRVATTVHRLLAKAFIPNPENKPFVNHIDGNKQNNNLDNLEWCTASENQTHAYKEGLNRPGYKKVRCVETGRIFASMKAAAEWANLVSYKSITEVCAGRKKTAGGFRWEKVR